MPGIAAGMLQACGVRGAERQMGVMMAALPVAVSAHILSTRYETGEAATALMIVTSSVLMLPVQLMWLAITDAGGWGAVPVAAATNMTMA